MESPEQIQVKGALVDNMTRCIHYHSALDIIAIKLKCCQTYYPCYYCHQEEADHEAQQWPESEWDTRAILCGVCKMEMTIREYLDSSYTCPACGAPFNPGCRNHNHLYFKMT